MSNTERWIWRIVTLPFVVVAVAPFILALFIASKIESAWNDHDAPAPKVGPPVHRSDCALHNMPYKPNGPCDCGAEPEKAKEPRE